MLLLGLDCSLVKLSRAVAHMRLMSVIPLCYLAVLTVLCIFSASMPLMPSHLQII